MEWCDGGGVQNHLSVSQARSKSSSLEKNILVSARLPSVNTQTAFLRNEYDVTIASVFLSHSAQIAADEC